MMTQIKMDHASVTLTPNRRLARHLYQAAAVPINQWLEECYLKSQDPRILLNKHQEKLLWQKIIADTLGAEFTNITDTVIKAYELLTKWQIFYQESDIDSQDFIVFRQLAKKFEDFCAKNHLITNCKLPSLLIPYIEQTQPKINLLGFDECWPQLQTLFASLKVTKQDPNNQPNAVCRLISCNNTSSEITLAARWAKQIITNKPKAKIGIVINNLTDLRTQIIRIFTQVLGGNSNFNISAGEILTQIPIIKYALELLSLREPYNLITISTLLLSNYFKTPTGEQSDRILLEWQLQQSVDAKTKLYIKDLEYFAKKYQRNIAEFIAILVKIQDIIQNTRNTKLLNTDWIEVFTQILQIVGWPEAADKSLSPSLLNEQSNQSLPNEPLSSPFTKQSANTLLNCHGANNTPRNDDIFCHSIDALYDDEKLDCFVKNTRNDGILGCELTEYELQAINSFNEALQEISHADLITGKVYYQQSLRNLRNLLDNIVFQVSTKNNPKIHILGTLEAAGINFDYLWIMGMDQKNWPKAANPNPFIPIKLQRQFNLPQSNAERELEFCTRLINRFKRSAAAIIFSYVNQEEDRVIAPSPLIADIAPINLEDLDLADFIDPAEQIYINKNAITATSALRNDGLDQVVLMPHESIQGGSKLLEMQSLCPFRAFTEFRLKVKEVKRLEPGISKITRGILIHKILEQFWQQIKTQQNLCALTSHELQNIIQDKIQYALDKARIPQHLYRLEQQCLTRLMHRWLEIEKKRDDFTVIAIEKTLETQIGALKIQLRIDRIDRLADGSLMVIDYKSGKILPAINDWFGARPASIQLPIYCVAMDQLQGLALAQVNTQILKLKTIGLEELSTGMTTTRSVIASKAKQFSDNDENNTNFQPGKQSSGRQTVECLDWEKLTNYWREILEKLAQDFVCGKAQVDPLNAQVCQTCALGSLCRK